MDRLVILDRDGVINTDSPDYIKHPGEWHAIPGSLEAIARLNHAGYVVVIATNQSGIGRGLYTLEALQAIHQKMHDALHHVGGHIDQIYFCPHTPDDHCKCRKPKTGLFEKIAKDWHVNLKNVYCIGDSFRDIQASMQVHAKTILVKTGNGLNTLNEHQAELSHVTIFEDLAEAVQFILNKTSLICGLSKD